jgi:HSP20 family molecular chaperone IbpA
MEKKQLSEYLKLQGSIYKVEHDAGIRMIKIPIPGLEMEDIDISFDDGKLTVITKNHSDFTAKSTRVIELGPEYTLHSENIYKGILNIGFVS